MSIRTFDNEIIEIIKIAEKYPSIKRIGIFGSYARGGYRSDSDIDLIYDYDELGNTSTDEILSYIEEIDDKLKNFTQIEKIDYVWYKGVLKSKNIEFRDAVLKDVIWIYNE